MRNGEKKFNLPRNKGIIIYSIHSGELVFTALNTKTPRELLPEGFS